MRSEDVRISGGGGIIGELLEIDSASEARLGDVCRLREMKASVSALACRQEAVVRGSESAYKSRIRKRVRRAGAPCSRQRRRITLWRGSRKSCLQHQAPYAPSDERPGVRARLEQKEARHARSDEGIYHRPCRMLRRLGEIEIIWHVKRMASSRLAMLSILTRAICALGGRCAHAGIGGEKPICCINGMSKSWRDATLTVVTSMPCVSSFCVLALAIPYVSAGNRVVVVATRPSMACMTWRGEVMCQRDSKPA